MNLIFFRRAGKLAESSIVEAKKPFKKRRATIAVSNTKMLQDDLGKPEIPENHVKKLSKIRRSTIAGSTTIPNSKVQEEADVKVPSKRRRSSISGYSISGSTAVTSKNIDLQKSNSSDSVTSTDSNEIMQKTNKNEVKKPAKKRKSSSSFIEPREIPRLGAKTLDLEDVGTDGSSQSGDEQRPRRQLNNNMFFDSVALSSRVLFPVEVKFSKK